MWTWRAIRGDKLWRRAEPLFLKAGSGKLWEFSGAVPPGYFERMREKGCDFVICADGRPMARCRMDWGCQPIHLPGDRITVELKMEANEVTL